MRKTLLFLYLLSLGSIAAYGQTRLTQDPKLERQLHESGLIHQPLPWILKTLSKPTDGKGGLAKRSSHPLGRYRGMESFRRRKHVLQYGKDRFRQRQHQTAIPHIHREKGDRLSFRPRLCHLRKQQCYLSSRRRQSGEVQPHRILHLSRLRRRAHRQHEPHVSQCRYSCQERI